MATEFIGRKDELKALTSLLEQRSANFVVVKGRRRIGKSRLIKEFAKDTKKLYAFSGLPPTSSTTAQSQRDEFARQLAENLELPGLKGEDWGNLFTLLAKYAQKGRAIIFFDEISWMGSKDSDFLGKLKNAWDGQFSQNPKLMLILCGSVSSWIEKNIVNSTGFVGRPSLYLTLDELPISDCNAFWNKKQGISAYEKFKVVSVTGGVPRYLELINPKLSAEENIKQLCFTRYGALTNEFEHIFTDIFAHRSQLYKHILLQLSSGSLDQESLAKKVGIPQSGDLSEYLNDLALSGFIARDFTWSLKTGKLSKLSRYRLKDNYVRFYLKYILPNKAKIDKGSFHARTLSALPGWDGMIGLQFENLVLNNHRTIIQLLGIHPDDVIFENPFFQRKTARQRGCQIDYLIQTRFNCVYICEIKFSRFVIVPDVIQEIKEKIFALKLPRHYSYRPVLIHVNGVREDVVESGFFAGIIDFSDLLIGREF